MSGGAQVTTPGGEQTGMQVTQHGGVTRVTPGGEAQQLPSGSQSESTPRPTGLPDEFKSMEEFVAKYNELSKTTPAAEQTQSPPPPPPPQAPPADDPRLAPYTEEFTKSGALSAETKAKAAKEFLPGVPETLALSMIDTYIAGMAGKATQSAAEVKVAAEPFHKAFGGADKYAEFSTWAETNIPEAELDAYNGLLDSNPTAALVMAQAFKSKWQAAGNSQPRDITAEAVPGEGEGVTGFKSVGEMKAAMADPRYAKDPVYRKEVEAKVAAAKF